MKTFLKFFLLRTKIFNDIRIKYNCLTRTKNSSAPSFQSQSLHTCSLKAENLFVYECSRCFHTTFRRKDKFSVESQGEKKPENEIIYYGDLTARIKGLKIFACISSLGSLVAVPLMLQNILNQSNFTIGVIFCTGIAAFTFFTPILIHGITKRYVTKIAYDSATDTFTATTLSFFLSNVNLEFKIEDIKIPNSFSPLTTMVIKDKPVFIISEDFFDNKYYIKMMKYDKPIDLKLKSDDISQNFRKKA